MDFYDESGSPIPVPDYDWELRYYTKKNSVSIKSVDGNLPDNTFIEEDGKLHIYLDAPELGFGEVWRETTLHIPDERFADGVRTSVSVKRVGVITQQGDEITCNDIR